MNNAAPKYMLQDDDIGLRVLQKWELTGSGVTNKCPLASTNNHCDHKTRGGNKKKTHEERTSGGPAPRSHCTCPGLSTVLLPATLSSHYLDTKFQTLLTGENV